MSVHFWDASLWGFFVGPGIGIGYHDGVEQGGMG